MNKKSHVISLFFLIATAAHIFPQTQQNQTAASAEIETQTQAEKSTDTKYATPFALSIKKDIAATAAALSIAAVYTIYTNIEGTKDWNGAIYDKSDVNSFDRFFMHSYNDNLDKLSNVAVGLTDVLPYVAVAAPLFLAEYSNRRSSTDEEKNFFSDYSNSLTAVTIYAETLIFARVSSHAIKAFTNRARPFMYYDSTAPQDRIDSGDWDCSFPSGHTTMAFAGAVCSSYMFCEYFPESHWKIPVTAASLALATTTAVLRVESGNHFATDVITGALLGSAVGFLTPFAHRISTKSTQVAVSPISFSVRHEY